MENYNNLMKTDVITQLCQENIDNCCYRRANTFTTEPLQKELRTFPDHGAQQIGHSTSQEEENEKNASQLEDKLEENDLDKLKILLDYEDAPEHLQFNPYIRSGYRTFLPTKLCFQSIFWWTNETVNIWSHIFGLLLFVALSIHDLKFLSMHAATTDKVIVGCLLICFQICMLLSSIYHIFSCRSAEDYDSFLNYDLFGIALSLLAIYISGVYYAFWCHDGLRYFYTFTVIAIFIFALVLQMPRLNVSSNAKIIIFVAWALYGFIPTIHWTFEMGGFQHPIVRLLIPRVIIMYLISGLAFLIYWAKIPERWFAGKLDYCGHSHNWWHIFVLAALYHWHDTGVRFAAYMIEKGCMFNKELCYRL